MKQIVINIIFILLVLNSKTFAQKARFMQLNVDNGLAQNSVFCIAQDKNGFVWISTEGGINRYDGKSVKVFRHNPDDPSSVSSNNVIAILPDADNYLWIATRDNGLNRMNLKSGKIEKFKCDSDGNGKINSIHILSLAEGIDGKIYIGTLDKGLNIYDKKTKKFTSISKDSANPNSLNSDAVRSISVDRFGTVWMGSFNGGVTSYNPKTKKCRRFFELNSDANARLNNNVVRALYCDKHDRVWISTWSGGVNVFHITENKMYSSNAPIDPHYEKFVKSGNLKKLNPKLENSLYSDLNHLRMVFGFAEDDNGNIWIAGVESGLTCYNHETRKITNFKNDPYDPQSLCENNLFCVAVDATGLVWSGSMSTGVSVFNPYSYQYGLYNSSAIQENDLHNSQVWSTHYGKYSGNIYVGILGGVYVFMPDSNKFVNYVTDKNGNNLIHPQGICQAIYEDYYGNLWVSVNGAGVYRYNKKTKEFVPNHPQFGEKNLANITVLDMDEDKDKNVWFAIGFGGIDRYDLKNNEFVHHFYNPKQKGSMSSYSVRDITFDRDGNLWAATDSGINLLKKNTNEFVVYRKDKGNSKLISNDVFSIFCDKNGVIWAGSTRGLSKFNVSSQTFENISANNKLLDELINGIDEDKTGNLWIGTSHGLVSLNKYNFNYKIYNFSDGFQGSEFNSQSLHALPNGYVIAGGSKGMNYFYPPSLKQNTIVPQVSITGIFLRNKALELETSPTFTKELVLDYDHYFFTVEFAALDFVNISKNKYKYKLSGFSEEWIQLGNKSEVTFVNLNPGEYTLHIAACNNDEIWNNAGIALKIIITPPFWKTTWFYFLIGISTLFILFVYIKWREGKLKNEKIVLESKVNERTRELREEKEKVEEAHKEIRDSINYAQRIQHALLAQEKILNENLPNHFVLFKPKDVVSGDFYWSAIQENEIYLAACDSTGHGVPGAFMSLLNISFLNEAINEKKIKNPAKVFDHVRSRLIENISQEGVRDGMDGILVQLNFLSNEMKIKYAASNNSPIVIRNHELIELKYDKMPIGNSEQMCPFTEHEFVLMKGDLLYLYTDGYADQFGGPKGKKFKYSNLNKLLLEISSLEMTLQQDRLNFEFEKWKGALEQLDDVCIIGIKF